jgi:iron complex outermembrane receptor protein
VNPQVGLFVATPDGGRVRVDVSRKTRLPAIKDRFSYRMGAAIPNPDLRAEQATTAEAGYDRAIDRYGTVSLVGYYTAVNDLVQLFYLQPNLFQLQNVGNVRNSGLEGEWVTRNVRSIQGRFGYSFLHRANVNGTKVPLLNTPNHKVFGSVIYSRVPRVRFIGSLNHESSRTSQDDAGLLLSLNGYTTISAKASLTVAPGLDLELTASNLYDRNYQLCPGFPDAGRVVAVNIRCRY